MEKKVVTYVYHHRTEYEPSAFLAMVREGLEAEIEHAKHNLEKFNSAENKVLAAYETYYGSGDDGIVKVIDENGNERDVE